MKKQINRHSSLRWIAFIFLFCFSSLSVFCTDYFFFYVQLKNKNGSPYTLSNPSEYLSERAIQRRIARMVAIDSTDFPVNPAYIQQLKQLGVHVHCQSKWLNGVTVRLTDTTVMSSVRALDCVKFAQYTGKISSASGVKAQKTTATTPEYGIAGTQIDQLKAKFLHTLGFRAKGIVIAVIDAGFSNVNYNAAFDSLRLQNRLLGTKDIIEPNSNIYLQDVHGAMVLSTMTGNIAGQFLGTAPDASYYLIRTEYGPTENLVETDFWSAGAEYADSVGVDIINSSLGYTTFDEPSMNYSYADMNGKVSRCSQSAEMAAKKGIIVVNSAGNDGNKTWYYIGAPSDAKGIICVGAVTSTGTSSTFSSYGPSSDGRVKPELCAMGTLSGVVNTAGSPTTSNGTSFASPILAGAVACFLQAANTNIGHFKIDTLINTLIKSGSRYLAPTPQQGYGIPDFETAYNLLIKPSKVTETCQHTLHLMYQANTNSIQISSTNTIADTQFNFSISTLTGNCLLNKNIQLPCTVTLPGLKTGFYIVKLQNKNRQVVEKIIIP